MLQDFADKAVQIALQNGVKYCDVRAEIVKSNGFLLENGQIEHFSSKFENGLGIRVLADGAWGFYSMSNPRSMDKLKEGISGAIKN
ncbi:MAG: TldD/PmbA family protein, partial [Thaumarchaeota archaeon]|nr:TldD/PmbA family protein [Nitrososphaerota archaeon]